MYRRAGNPNQVIAFAAVLLSLLSLAQNAGLSCYLGTCEAELVGSSVADKPCCHRRTCHTQEQPTPCAEPLGQSHDSCPCSDSCWCHQAPQPFEMPRSFDEPLELALLRVFAVSDNLVDSGIFNQRTAITWAMPPDLDDKSAVCRCAKLCRFLI